MRRSVVVDLVQPVAVIEEDLSRPLRGERPQKKLANCSGQYRQIITNP
jgi:hypothetical protein